MGNITLKKEIVALKGKLYYEKARRVRILTMANAGFYKHLFLLIAKKISEAFRITKSDVFEFWYSRESDKISKKWRE